jgi:DegV family protein with EDD domain
MPKVAVLTDSTASLTREAVEEHGIVVVPMQVVIAGRSYDDGVDPEASAPNLARALRDFLPVSTSRPSPAAVLAAYRRAAADGAEEIVSVHVSSQVSATCESALLAAKDSPVPVHVVDSLQMGAGTGYAALTAAEAVAAGATAQEAAEAARRRAHATTSLFYVDTLEYLRRGGRVGAAAALLGSALAVKPILEVVDGRIGPRDKVRTAARALSRLEELAVAAAADRPVDVTVSHLAAEQQAGALAARLRERLAPLLGEGQLQVTEVPAVLGAHVGPGLVGVTLSPRQPSPS